MVVAATRAPLTSLASMGVPGRVSRLSSIYRETLASSLCPDPQPEGCLMMSQWSLCPGGP